MQVAVTKLGKFILFFVLMFGSFLLWETLSMCSDVLPEAYASTVFPEGEDVLEEGSAIFRSKCAVCHGMKGQGMVGANLTDKYWLHGNGSLEAIYDTVTNGVLEQGMVAWKKELSEDEILAVTVFVHSLQGTNPPKPKAPQGEMIE